MAMLRRAFLKKTGPLVAALNFPSASEKNKGMLGFLTFSPTYMNFAALSPVYFLMIFFFTETV